MRRRWWIASGVLLAVLAVVAVVLDRAAADRTTPDELELRTTFGDVPLDVAPWERTLTLTRPALLGVGLVLLGLVVAVAVLARRWGADARLRAAHVSDAAVERNDELADDEQARPGVAAEVAGQAPATTGSPWLRVTALLLAAGLVVAGAFVVLTNRLGDPVLANGGKGIAILDNIAAVPFDDGPISTGWWSDPASGEPAGSVLGLADAGAGLVDTTRVSAFAWAAAALGLLLVTGAVAYAVGRRRWASAVPVGVLGILLVSGSLILAALSPVPRGEVFYWGAYTPLPGVPMSDALAGIDSPSTQETVPMPDVVGEDYDRAEIQLREAGFWAIEPGEAGRDASGSELAVVRSQSPAAGTQVVPGAVVVVLDTRTP
ncbi:MAG: PASTA domain-containing protein [Candidatus Nanopelagicales bacterium]